MVYEDHATGHRGRAGRERIGIKQLKCDIEIASMDEIIEAKIDEACPRCGGKIEQAEGGGMCQDVYACGFSW